MAIIDVQHLHHAYPPARRNEEPRIVLSDLSFIVPSGAVFGLLGPNGGGKTTLFKILSTLLQPSKGDALINGFSVMNEPNAVRQSIGIVFQNPSLDKKLTLQENLIHQGRLYGLSEPALSTRASELLERLRLTSRAHDFVEHLSGGLQRRGEIAKGLLHKPTILLMDEPSTGLDPGARRDLWTLIDDLKKEGMTILVTTHLMEEGDKCDRLGILNKGHLVAVGTPDELKNKIGGDVLRIQSESPEKLATALQEKFNLSVSIRGQTLRLEKREGHKFIPPLVEAFPGLIESITMGKPTLEDVFIRETGEHLWHEDAVLK